jgi:hypothetical protein
VSVLIIQRGLLYCTALLIVCNDAVRYWAENSVFDSATRADSTKDAIASFCSGHAALSMAGILFVSLVLWRDVSQWPVTLYKRKLMPVYVSAAYFTLM